MILLLLISTVQIQAQDADAIRRELTKYPHKILFEGYAKDNWDLFVMNADGSGIRNLTNTPKQHELYPQASPDGKMICFLRDVGSGRDTQRSVYVMNADGTDRRKVADKARQPCWSPDSAKIAYVPQEFKRFAIADFASKGLRIYDVASGKTSDVANKSIHHLYGLNWSADGKWIVSTVHGGMGFGHAILAIELAGTRVKNLKIPGCRPCLSSTGSLITWSSNDHTISLADVSLAGDSVTVSKVRSLEKHGKMHLYHPDLSPDGKYVVFSRGPGGRVQANGPGTHTQVAEMVGVRGKWHLYVKRSDQKGPAIQITFGENSTSKEAEWIRVRKDDN